jgi:hypothetical protein
MLPTLSVPEFKTKLPSTNKNIKFRPFLVKEEKILLIALEDGEKETIIGAVKDLLKNCILTKGIDIDKLSTFDVEWLFMQIRSKSVGEQIEMTLSHNGDSECKARTKYVFDIEDLSITGSVSDGKIELDNSIGIKLTYPTYSDEKMMERTASNLFAMVKDNVEYIYDNDNVYDEFTTEELDEWLDHLNKDQFEKILAFFTDGPSLSHLIEWDCAECGEKDYALVEGLKDFFMLV